MPKPTGLAAFTRPAVREVPAAPERSRGKHERVPVTIRLSRASWERLVAFAASEGATLQQLGLRGFSALLRERGLPGLDDA